MPRSREEEFKRNNNFHSITYMATPSQENPGGGGVIFIILMDPFLHNFMFYILTLSYQCPVVGNQVFFREIIYFQSLTYDHTLAQELLPHGGIKMVCLFVCLEFFVPVENFSFIWRRHHYRRRAANFDLCSAFMVIEQWGFFSVPHLLWHGASVYNGYLRGSVTLTAIAERLAVELSLPVLST